MTYPRISHVFHFPKKAGEVQSFIHYNFTQAGGLSATESVPEELEVFDCIYLGSTALKRKQKADDPTLERSVGAPRGPLHGGRSTRAAPRVGVADFFIILTCAQY